MDLNASTLPANYSELLDSLRREIRGTQSRAQRVVNSALIDLYWVIGRTILDQQEQEGWGSGVVARLADDLRKDFPSMTGLSRSNLRYMRSMAALWPDRSAIYQQ